MNEMTVNLKKEDVAKAVEILRKEVLKESRQRFRIGVLLHTKLFGYKIRSYKKAKAKYIKDSYYNFIKDPVYGYRDYMWQERYIKEIDTLLRCDVNDVVTLPLSHVELLEKYVEC